jgi:hypothetical protein
VARDFSPANAAKGDHDPAELAPRRRDAIRAVDDTIPPQLISSTIR